MKVSINIIKAAFFDRLFEDAMRTVIHESESHSIFATFEEFEGIGLSGFGHEAVALLLLDCMTGIPEEIGGDLLEDLVLKSLIECKVKGSPDKTGFLKSLENRCESYLKSDLVVYSCMFFLQTTNLPSWIHKFPILDHKIQKAPALAWKAMEGSLAEICDRTGVPEDSIRRMIAVEIHVKARRPQDAIGMADQVSQILRGSLLASFEQGWQLGGPRNATNQFKPSPLYFVRTGSKHVQWAFIPDVETGFLKLPDECPEITKMLLKKLANVPQANSTNETLSKAISLFSAACDRRLPSDEFLGMWQSLECMSMAGSGDTTKIALSIAKFWKNGNDSVYPQLQALAKFRNNLVHVGEYDAERQSATYLLGQIVRSAIRQFAILADKLPTQGHFVEYLSLVSLPNREFETKFQTIDIVKKMREKKK